MSGQIGSITTLTKAIATLATTASDADSTLTTDATEYFEIFGIVVGLGTASAALDLAVTVACGAVTVLAGEVGGSTIGTFGIPIMLPPGTWYESAPGEDIVVTVTCTGGTATRIKYTLFYRKRKVVK